MNVFQSTLPAWGATGRPLAKMKFMKISIHAPRVGSDREARHFAWNFGNFNPRSPRGERRSSSLLLRLSQNFNPRSPRGERLMCSFLRGAFHGFQSTLPAWGATRGERRLCAGARISIHAPRVGSDRRCVVFGERDEQFQSTLPAWGATPASIPGVHAVTFQSTLPAWGATRRLSPRRLQGRISIHAPRVGSDARMMVAHNATLKFQSTLPAWGATTAICRPVSS